MQRRAFLKAAVAGVLGARLRAAGKKSQLWAGEEPPAQQLRYIRWSWQRWLQITGAKRPGIRTDQSGKRELVDLLRTGGKELKTAEAWEHRRGEIEAVLREFLGPPPSERPPLDARVVEERRFVDFIRRKVIFTSEPGEVIPSYLFVPTELKGRAPAMLTPHQTNYDGKLEPAGIRGEPSLALAVQLAQRGYVTLAADAIAFGERHEPSSGHYGDAIEFYYRHPQWSVMGKMNWDKGRAIDYLQSLEFVDADRIGTIGHSHGAYGSLWAAAFDPRIKVVVASCGFDTFRADGNTWRWSHGTALLPKLGFYLGDAGAKLSLENFQDYWVEEVTEVPFDYHHVLSLIAPRPTFYAVALDDEVFPHAESTVEAINLTRKVYQLYGADERVAVHTFPGGHRFPASVRRQAFAWLDRWLMGDG